MKKIFIAVITLVIFAACAFDYEESAAVYEPTDLVPAEDAGFFPFAPGTLDINGDIVMDLPEREFYFVYLWATWCGPCVAALSTLGELYAEFGDRVGFLGFMVDFETGGDIAVGLTENAGATFPHVSRTANAELAEILNTGFVPSAGLFYADGSLVGGGLAPGTRHYRLFIETALGL